MEPCINQAPPLIALSFHRLVSGHRPGARLYSNESKPSPRRLRFFSLSSYYLPRLRIAIRSDKIREEAVLLILIPQTCSLFLPVYSKGGEILVTAGMGLNRGAELPPLVPSRRSARLSPPLPAGPTLLMHMAESQEMNIMSSGTKP